MKYAVIGGAGFIGSHVMDKLVEKGHEVVVIDNLVSGQMKHINPAAKFGWGDIRSYEDLKRIFYEHQFNRVINLAAQPYIPKCFDDPKLFFETNVTGALHVLMACEEFGVGRMLQYASAEEYGTQKGKIDETVPIRPQSTYGVSKIAADYLCSVRHRESGINAIALRQFNCYGPRETHEYVIPEIISQIAASGEKLSTTLKLGNIKSERDFLYVGDAAEYAIELLEKGEPGEVYNLGSEDCISIEDLAHLIAKLMDVEFLHIEIDPEKLRPWDIERLQSDNAKIHSVVEYRAKTSFEDGLRKTIGYFYGNGKKWDF